MENFAGKSQWRDVAVDSWCVAVFQLRRRYGPECRLCGHACWCCGSECWFYGPVLAPVLTLSDLETRPRSRGRLILCRVTSCIYIRMQAHSCFDSSVIVRYVISFCSAVVCLFSIICEMCSQIRPSITRQQKIHENTHNSKKLQLICCCGVSS